MSEWKTIDTAPRTGELIQLVSDWDFDLVYDMRWDATMTNGLFPGVVGMWVTPHKGMTWTGSPDEGGPTHWRRIRPDGVATIY